MDKKNTLLLTVIAVATLLVAVVGATFAYFNVTGNSNNLTPTVQKHGTVTLTGNTPAMYFKVTNNQMSKNASLNGDVTYYSKDKNEETDTTLRTHTLATIESSGNEDETKYECDFTLTLQTTNAGSSLADSKSLAAYTALSDNDGKITLDVTSNNDNKIILKREGGLSFGLGTSKTLQTISGKVEFVGNTSAAITAQTILVNSQNENQDYLEELNTSTVINITSISCDTVEN